MVSFSKGTFQSKDQREPGSDAHDQPRREVRAQKRHPAGLIEKDDHGRQQGRVHRGVQCQEEKLKGVAGGGELDAEQAASFPYPRGLEWPQRRTAPVAYE